MRLPARSQPASRSATGTQPPSPRVRPMRPGSCRSTRLMNLLTVTMRLLLLFIGWFLSSFSC